MFPRSSTEQYDSHVFLVSRANYPFSDVVKVSQFWLRLGFAGHTLGAFLWAEIGSL